MCEKSQKHYVLNQHFSELDKLDSDIEALLGEKDASSETMKEMLKVRSGLIQNILTLYSLKKREEGGDPELDAAWRKRIFKTQKIVQAMSSTTFELGQELQRYRYGNQSIQQYKHFSQ